MPGPVAPRHAFANTASARGRHQPSRHPRAQGSERRPPLRSTPLPPTRSVRSLPSSCGRRRRRATRASARAEVQYFRIGPRRRCSSGIARTNSVSRTSSNGWRSSMPASAAARALPSRKKLCSPPVSDRTRSSTAKDPPRGFSGKRSASTGRRNHDGRRAMPARAAMPEANGLRYSLHRQRQGGPESCLQPGDWGLACVVGPGVVAIAPHQREQPPAANEVGVVKDAAGVREISAGAGKRHAIPTDVHRSPQSLGHDVGGHRRDIHPGRGALRDAPRRRRRWYEYRSDAASTRDGVDVFTLVGFRAVGKHHAEERRPGAVRNQQVRDQRDRRRVDAAAQCGGNRRRASHARGNTAYEQVAAVGRVFVIRVIEDAPLWFGGPVAM